MLSNDRLDISASMKAGPVDGHNNSNSQSRIISQTSIDLSNRKIELSREDKSIDKSKASVREAASKAEVADLDISDIKPMPQMKDQSESDCNLSSDNNSEHAPLVKHADTKQHTQNTS